MIFEIPPTSLVVFSISSVANSKIKKSGRGGRAHLSFKKQIKAIRALSSAAALADRLREMTLLLAEKPVHLHEPTHLQIRSASASDWLGTIRNSIKFSNPINF